MPPLSSRAAFSSTRRMQRAHGVPFFPLGHPAESCIPPLEPRMQTSTGALTWAAARIPLDGLAADHFEPRSCPHASRSRHVNATVVSGGDAQTRKSSPRVPVNASLLHGQAAGAFCCCSWLSAALLDSAPLASGSVSTFKIASGAVPVDFPACTQHV